MRQKTGNSRYPGFRRSTLGAAVAIALAGGSTSVMAFEFQHGELSGSFDTTVSLGALWRMEKPESSLISIANGGTSRDPNSDDGNLRYERGELVSTVLKATHDLELKYHNFGAFVRGSYFYDPTIRAKDSLTRDARDILGSDAEILDAYVRGNFKVGDRNLNVRLGKQVVSWGESTFIQNGINVLNPVNVSRLRAPGSELKEGFIPTMMAYASQELTDNLSVEVALLTEWKKTKIDPAGSFFSTNDFVSEGGNIAYTGFGRRNDLNGAAGTFLANGNAALWAPRSNDREASKDGQYGIAFRYFAPQLNNTEFGFYHANYHSRTPYVSGYRGAITTGGTLIGGACNGNRLDIPTFGSVFNGSNPYDATTDACDYAAAQTAAANAAGRTNSGTYFVEYPEDIKLFGLSFNTALPSGIALQGEYSYRPNQPLQLPSAELLGAALGIGNQLTSTNPGQAFAVPYGTEISGYRRVKMHQVQMTGTKAFSQVLGAEQLVVVGEVGYTRLQLPSNLKFAASGCHLPQPGSANSTSYGSTSTDCFATENSWGYRLVGRLDYPNAIGAVTVSPRVAFSHDVSGRSPTFNEGAKALTLGFGFNYRQNWQADIAYTAFFGGKKISGVDDATVPGFPSDQSASYASHTNPMVDRDFLSISLSYSF